MCGIAGILKVWTPAQRELALRTPHGESITESWLDILDDSIKHRGPDGQGRFRDRAIRADGCVVDVALVHRRLSIIDHAGGHQPMVWERLGGGAGILSEADVRRYTVQAATQVWSDIGARPGSEHGQDARAADRIAVVFNGCIYNHRELRGELQKAGHVFGTDHSDTEVLVHGWREWGTELPKRLEGMFAFAIWDTARHTLFAARDQFGEKPLYILDGTALIFDPEYEKTVLRSCEEGQLTRRPISKPIFAMASAHGAIERLQIAACIQDHPPRKDADECDGSRLTALLARGYGDWHGITPTGVGYCMQPGHWQSFGRQRLDQDGYVIHDAEWSNLSGQFAQRSVTPPGSEYRRFGGPKPPPVGQLVPDGVDRLLRQAVARRVEADVPMGAFLSGGVDSSLVSLYARETLGRLRTFSLKMPDPRYDESEAAEAVAKLIGSDHTTLRCEPHPAEDLQRLIPQLGMPFGDSSLLPMYWTSRAAREHVAVVLTGDGGDELFAGYERHMAHFALHRWRWLLAMAPLSAISDKDPRSKWSKARRLIEVARSGEAHELANVFAPSDLERLTAGTRLKCPRLEGLAGVMVMESLINCVLPGRWPRSFGFHLTMGLDYLTGDLLRKADTATMAVALESRAPFLDSDLVAAVHAANPLDLIPRRQRKGLLRQVARKYLPAEIVDRPKMGFAIPIGEWFRSDYGGLRTMLLDHLNSTEPFGPPSLGIDLNMRFIRQMLDEHLGTGPGGQIKRDHSQRLYMLLVLSIWAKWMGGLRSEEAKK